MPVSGSARRYFRMQSGDFSAIGVYNADSKENRAFLAFSRHFAAKGLPVPVVLAEDLAQDIYLEEDLGDETLFSYRSRSAEFTPELKEKYRSVLQNLLVFQTKGAEGMDASWCYPRACFDAQSIAWDLNYFKYYFLKLAQVPFDEQSLENDFQTLTKFLLQADNRFFLYRDFQSRNIMLKGDALYFIDYQGGRKGALPYDVASLLYDGKADIPAEVRDELLECYLDRLGASGVWPVEEFRKYYPAFVLVRILQAMGSYGYRGFYERKTHFLSSVPYALRNVAYLLEHSRWEVDFPHLRSVLLSLSASEKLASLSTEPLTLEVRSFSFRKGLPADDSGHGGGFVFDCRSLPNPGREEAYRHLTGQHPDVIAYLERQGSVAVYFEHVKALIENALENYQSRKFTHLSVSFGCTGGQHRSVYFAERTAAYFQKKYPLIRVRLSHLAAGNWDIEPETTNG
ncbi:MAG: phosphotransferase [Bacteroidales bacterium]|nr:phosphotransferase [Bacteroidales bacterium]